MLRTIIAILLIIIGSFNELSGIMAYYGANGVVQQIGGLCMLILGTPQFILAYLIWPKKA